MTTPAITRAQRAQRKAPRASRPHMPGYGLPRGRRGLLPWRWAEQRLKRSHNYWVVTVRPDRRPHAMPVWGLWLDGAFFFSTGGRSVKARNLARNARCVVCTEQAAEAVVMEGTARPVKDKPLLARIAVPYRRKYDFALDPALGPVFAVRPRVVFGLDEKRFLAAATRWGF